MKNRTIIGIFCIILAVTVMFGVTPIVNRLAEKKVDIVRVTKDISQGQKITADDIKIVTVGGYNLPGDVIKTSKSVIGKYAVCDIKADDYLLPSKLSGTADSASDVLKTLDGTKQAISITIPSFADGLSGKIQNGDIISVIVVSNGESTIPAELTYMKVITTTTSKGIDNDQSTSKTSSTSDLPSTVTLLVNSAQAKLLALYEQNSKIHITLVYRGSVEKANQFLQVQDKVFESGVKSDG